MYVFDLTAFNNLQRCWKVAACISESDAELAHRTYRLRTGDDRKQLNWLSTSKHMPMPAIV